jgi:hypothetical protein
MFCDSYFLLYSAVGSVFNDILYIVLIYIKLFIRKKDDWSFWDKNRPIPKKSSLSVTEKQACP